MISSEKMTKSKPKRKKEESPMAMLFLSLLGFRSGFLLSLA